MDALVNNVYNHTPDDTGYAVAVAVDGDTAVLRIDDTGPGIPDPDAVLPRGHTSARSTGLGLDIARRAAEAAGGQLAIGRSTLGGASVTLTFPVAT